MAMDEAQAKTAGATEAKARIQAILGHANAKGRGALAAELAFNTDLGVDACAGILATAAIEVDPAVEAANAAAATAKAENERKAAEEAARTSAAATAEANLAHLRTTSPSVQGDTQAGVGDREKRRADLAGTFGFMKRKTA